MSTLHQALLASASVSPQPALDLVTTIATDLHVDREHVVGALWDLIEDEALTYDANALVRIVRP